MPGARGVGGVVGSSGVPLWPKPGGGLAKADVMGLALAPPAQVLRRTSSEDSRTSSSSSSAALTGMSEESLGGGGSSRDGSVGGGSIASTTSTSGKGLKQYVYYMQAHSPHPEGVRGSKWTYFHGVGERGSDHKSVFMGQLLGAQDEPVNQVVAGVLRNNKDPARNAALVLDLERDHFFLLPVPGLERVARKHEFLPDEDLLTLQVSQPSAEGEAARCSPE